MKNMFSSLFCLLGIVLSGMSWAAALPIEQIKLPKGFRITVFAEQVPNARSMALSPNGTLFVGTRREDKVYAAQDRDGDNKADRTFVLAKGLRMPNGVVFHEGDLYVAEMDRILKFPNIEDRLEDPGRPEIINDSLPEERSHGWKFIRLGPDGKLYVPIGAPCNICESRDERFATIARMNLDGSSFEIFARGIRNSVGFDWHPETQELWFTDNGRDWLGDNQPPDELNHAPVAGLHFGYPYFHGKDIRDPEFGGKAGDLEWTPAAQELGPHVAALGMRFYTGSMFPESYRNQIFIAEHGSWNRSVPIGYRIMLVRLEDNIPVSYEVFADGWLQGTVTWGRPVDIEMMPDGSLLVSDDHAGAIYRIVYEP